MENASLPDLFSLTELTSKACGTCAVARLMNAQKHSAIVSFRESFIAKILPSYDTERHNWYPLRLQNRRRQRTLFRSTHEDSISVGACQSPKSRLWETI